MYGTWRELVRVLDDARGLLQQPGNDFAWSSWPDAAAAAREIDGLVARIVAGRWPAREELAVLFAPTGPIQEVAMTSGWHASFLRLAAHFDAVWSAADAGPASPGTPPTRCGARDFRGPPGHAPKHAGPSRYKAESPPGGRAGGAPRIEARNSLFKTAFGAISSLVMASVSIRVLVVVVTFGDVDRQIARDFVIGGSAALLAFAALYGLQYHLRRLFDRSAKVVIGDDGVHDLRPPGRFIRRADIRDVVLSGVRRNGVVVHAKLTLILRFGRSRTLDVEGLDQTPEFLAAIVRSMFLS